MVDAAYGRAYYARNRERLLEKSKAWQASHAGYVKEWRRKYADRHKDNLRRQRYGISGDEYRQMVADQDGKCAICYREMTPPHVDHDHATGRVRGLLCDNCNRGIGHLKEDTTVLLAAIRYLNKEND